MTHRTHCYCPCAILRERERERESLARFFYSQVLGESLIEPDDENEELSFSVVDMNNALSSNAFWADAKEVPGWQRLFAAM